MQEEEGFRHDQAAAWSLVVGRAECSLLRPAAVQSHLKSCCFHLTPWSGLQRSYIAARFGTDWLFRRYWPPPGAWAICFEPCVQCAGQLFGLNTRFDLNIVGMTCAIISALLQGHD